MQDTINIEGRTFGLTVNEEPAFETTRNVWGEFTLTGIRGAEYSSERLLGTGVWRFWKASKPRSLPSLAFRDQSLYFTVENGEMRPATYNELKNLEATHQAYRSL